MQRPPSLLMRLKAAWLVLGCQGGPIFVKHAAAADPLEIARGQCVRTPYEVPSIGWRECERLNCRESCPRFEAYRQGLTAHEYRARDLCMPLCPDQIKPDVRNGDREAAQVDHFNEERLHSISAIPHGRLNPKAHPVLNPVAPGVVDTQDCAKQCDGEGHDLKNGFGVCSHGTTLAEEGGAA